MNIMTKHILLFFLWNCCVRSLEHLFMKQLLAKYPDLLIKLIFAHFFLSLHWVFTKRNENISKFITIHFWSFGNSSHVLDFCYIIFIAKIKRISIAVMENCTEHSHISIETFFIKLKKKQPRDVSIKKSCHYCEISNNTYFEKHICKRLLLTVSCNPRGKKIWNKCNVVLVYKIVLVVKRNR